MVKKVAFILVGVLCLMAGASGLFAQSKFGANFNIDRKFDLGVGEDTTNAFPASSGRKWFWPGLEMLAKGGKGYVHRIRIGDFDHGDFGLWRDLDEPIGSFFTCDIGYQGDILLGNKEGDKYFTPFIGYSASFDLTKINIHSPALYDNIESERRIGFNLGIVPGIRMGLYRTTFVELALPYNLLSLSMANQKFTDGASGSSFSSGLTYNLALRFGFGFWL